MPDMQKVADECFTKFRQDVRDMTHDERVEAAKAILHAAQPYARPQDPESVVVHNALLSMGYQLAAWADELRKEQDDE